MDNLLEKLNKELEEREGKTREEINQRLIQAKEFGDLSENAEFTEALEAKSFNEGRIEEIRQILRESEVVGSNGSTGVVTMGAKVKIKSNRGEMSFNIVGPSESNPSKGLISYESPVGAALMGHRKGDSVEVKTPSGMMTYSILSVE